MNFSFSTDPNGFSNPQFSNAGFPALFPEFMNLFAGFPFTGFGVPMGANPMGFSSYEDFLDHLMQQHQPRGTPPASKSFVDKLPIVVITQQQVDQKMECAICKDSFKIDEETIGLPCQHLYHGDCILPWLQQHNSCPVCRYELPVDDLEYEKQRREKMEKTRKEHVIQEDTIKNSNTNTNTNSNSNSNSYSYSSSKADKNEMESSTIPPPEQKQENEIDVSNMGCEYVRIRRQSCALFNEHTTIETLGCGHSFHDECLESSLRMDGSLRSNQSLQDVTALRCPICHQDTSILKDLDVD